MQHQVHAACVEAFNTCVTACSHCFASCLQEADMQMMGRCISLTQIVRSSVPLQPLLWLMAAKTPKQSAQLVQRCIKLAVMNAPSMM